MGPQPFGCGRAVKMYGMGFDVGFNGAATFRLRKGSSLASCRGRVSGFNGAATFRLRKGPSKPE